MSNLATAAVLMLCCLLCINATSPFPDGVPTKPKAEYFQHVYYNPTWPVGRQYSFNRPMNASTDIQAASIAVYNDGMANDGWDAVYVAAAYNLVVSPDLDVSTVGYHAAGYAEGYATAKAIYANYVDLEIEKLIKGFTNNTKLWVSGHIEYMWDMGEHEGPTNAFWAQVFKRLTQLEGMVAGYNDCPDSPKILTFEDLFMINFDFEIFDVMAATDYTHNVPTPPSVLEGKRLRGRHCSALIKHTGDDLYMAHNTWSSFETMLRQFKTYEFETTIAMSSYPATIHSGDDFYLLNNGLTVQETTNDNSNTSTYKFVYPESVSEFIRVMAANTLATTNQEWTELFCIANSGTYNNQYMVLNMTAFTPNKPFPEKDLLWIVEQMPGTCHAGDETKVLSQKTYWASYNRPFYLFEYSGFSTKMKEYGDYFSYDECPRAKLFARNQSLVKNMDGMHSIMRFCDFKNDPLSLVDNCLGAPNNKCDPAWSATNVIAARGDLNPKDGNWGAMTKYVGMVNMAAIDAKIVSHTTYTKSFSADIINGPTSEGVPPFKFSTSPYANVPHVGIPDLVQYPWTTSSAVFADATAAPQPAKPLPYVAVEYFVAVVDSMSNAQFHNMIKLVVGASADVLIKRNTARNAKHHEIEFFFTGPGSQDFTNFLASLSATKLEQWGFTSLSEILSTLPPNPTPSTNPLTNAPSSGEESKPYWIIGAVFGGVALIAILVIFVRRGTPHHRADGRYQTVDDVGMV